MALTPLPRPASSTQVLRYRGTVVVVGRDNSDVYPKANATAPGDSAIAPGGATFTAWVRFALFGVNTGTGLPTLADTKRRLPANVYDDSNLAGEAPHDPVVCAASATPGINLTDLSLDRFSWAQNLQIHFNNIDAHVVLCDNDVSIDNDPANGAVALLDNGTASGLGLGTGLPVIAVRFVVATTGGEFPALQNFDVDITFEIRHSDHR